jgi:cyclic beta-1,2-glucan synthetase
VATSRYVSITGDTSVLDERVGYIEGRPVNPGEDSYYDLPGHSALVETLYEHCVRAIEHGLTQGAHGLPLIGCGDWNDGMNRVGAQGRGESVWLGFFLYDVLLRFAKTAQAHDDDRLRQPLPGPSGGAAKNLEANGWDGEWYRRAYFDDGTPLGSAPQRRMQDRFDRAKLVGAVGRGFRRTTAGGDGFARSLPRQT